MDPFFVKIREFFCSFTLCSFDCKISLRSFWPRSRSAANRPFDDMRCSLSLFIFMWAIYANLCIINLNQLLRISIVIIYFQHFHYIASLLWFYMIITIYCIALQSKTINFLTIQNNAKRWRKIFVQFFQKNFFFIYSSCFSWRLRCTNLVLYILHSMMSFFIFVFRLFFYSNFFLFKLINIMLKQTVKRLLSSWTKQKHNIELYKIFVNSIYKIIRHKIQKCNDQHCTSGTRT